MKVIIQTLAVLGMFCSAAHAATNSTPVRIVDQPVTTQVAKTPMNVDVQFNMSGAVINPGSQLVYTVPADQLYVIESVSVWSFMTTARSS
jgi:hypothetical protein